MAARIWHLQSCALFAQLTPPELLWLESRCSSRDFARGSAIYLPAEAASAVLLLTRGRVRLSQLLPDGRQAILAFIGPGELFGELALMPSDDATAIRDERADAVDESTVVLIPRDVLHRLMEQYATVSMAIARLFGFRRQRIERRLTSLLFRDTRQRLACLLLDLAQDYGVPEAEETQVQLRLSHQDMADLIGSSRETVTLMLGEFQRSQYVRIGRRRLIVLDPHGLANIAGQAVGPVDAQAMPYPNTARGHGSRPAEPIPAQTLDPVIKRLRKTP